MQTRVLGENIIFSWRGLCNVTCSTAKPINSDLGFGNATQTGQYTRKTVSLFICIQTGGYFHLTHLPFKNNVTTDETTVFPVAKF